MSRRFRWTRRRYRKADSLARFFDRWVYNLPSEPPRLVRRLHELWAAHPQRSDPLLTPIRLRHTYLDDDIPF
jgi:hypothetical protein